MVCVDTKTLNENIKTLKLKAADILLVHTKHSVWGWIVRFGTHCYWNHALIVCSVGDIKEGLDNTLVVDAKTNGSIVITNMNEYLRRTDKYDVAVKRYESDWFQNGSHISYLDCRSHICNIAINEVDFKIGSRLVGYIDQIVRQFTVIFRFIRRKIRRVYKPPSLPWNIRPIQLKAFTCGGFIQWCYYKAVSRMLEERGASQSHIAEVIFNPRAKKELSPFELLTTTPADLANCDTLSWKYVIRNGVFKEITNSEEVDSAVLSM